MVLNEGPSFNPLKVAVDEALRFYCVPVGDGLEKTLEVSIKNPESGVIEWSQKITTRDSRKEIDFDIPKRAHGYYILEAVLSYGSVSAKPLVYEVVWAERGNKEPIIWLDTYPTEIADHDKLII